MSNTSSSVREGHSPVQSSPKRRRVALACQNCRERKVRCDGSRPVCSACRRRGITAPQCEYLVVAGTAKYQTERAYIQSLHAHLADLEGPLREQSPGQTQRSNQSSHSGGPLEAARQVCFEGDEVPLSSQELGEHQASPAGNTLPISLSAMGTAVPDTHDVAVRDQYYGQSSLVSLVQQCSQTSPARQSVRSQQQSAFSATPSSTFSASCNASSHGATMSTLLSDDFSLPPRKLADWLLEVYFTNNHLFYPWVHKESFMVTYEGLWTNQESTALGDLPDVGLGGHSCPPGVFYCALNAMFAIACQFSSMPPRDKRTSSAMFYERMKSLMNIDILDSGSLAYVQALLLVAIYLQCTPHPKRCWNVIGMAHRMAVGLGLQKRRQSDDLTSLEKEIRWRAWCACVQMDMYSFSVSLDETLKAYNVLRITSMTMGRPPMTQNSSQVPLPSPVDDQYLSMARNGAEQPEGTVSTNQFFHENMRLIEVLLKILLTIYHSTDNPSGHEAPHNTSENDLMAIMEIDKDLKKFESSVPSAFAWGPRSSPNIDRTFRRQSNVLHARYLHLKLLLYRPAFSAYCSAAISESETSPSHSWSILCQRNSAFGCVRAACELIDSLAKATAEDTTGAWWYGVFYLISSGIILVLAESSEADFNGVSRDQQVTAWDQCLETLNRMVDVHPSARDYSIALSGLRHSDGAQQNQGSDLSRDPTGLRTYETCANDESGQHRASLPQTDNTDSNVLSPFLRNWDTELEDIMLPAHFLQDIDEGLLLPNLF